jgi:hypothetical protein
MGRSGVWLVFVGGCGNGMDVTAEPADIPGVAFVTLDTDKTGEMWVHPPTGEDTPKVAVEGGPTEVTVLGLRAGEEVTLEVHFVDDGGKETTEEVTVTTEAPPPGIPAMQLTIPATAEACDPGGYVLFSWLGEGASGTGILDREGRYVWAVSADPTGIPWAEGKDAQVSRARPSRDGKSLLWLYGDEARVDDFAGVVRLSLDGRTRVDTRTVSAHHDFVELPDGKIGWLSYEFNDHPKAEVEGAPDTVPDPMYIASEGIYEAPEGTVDGEPYTTVWSMVDAGYPIYWSGTDMKCQDGFLGDGTCEFAHGNSLMFRDSDSAYFAMMRWTDALVRVDRAGGYAWQMGGRDTENDFLAGASDPFIHSHMSELWDGGMFVFDNRLKSSGEKSRLVEYTVDESTFTAASTWTFEGTQHDNLLGDVRQIPIEGCDNVIVSWTSQGRIVEMTRDGTEVWELSSPIGGATSRVHYLPSLYDVSTALALPSSD